MAVPVSVTPVSPAATGIRGFEGVSEPVLDCRDEGAPGVHTAQVVELRLEQHPIRREYLVIVLNPNRLNIHTPILLAKALHRPTAEPTPVYRHPVAPLRVALATRNSTDRRLLHYRRWVARSRSGGPLCPRVLAGGEWTSHSPRRPIHAEPDTAPVGRNETAIRAYPVGNATRGVREAVDG
ncbi:hypothetical protein Raf01_77730 [Rugosimonospora africana]|uniref:Uncharacterized protein n=1 Tax=Rugosimonospora africana TaxID=556532 RepID=A0A8J3VVA9_9ACTN|nr:hypothetical protein Raf01_77730 [Rugosimonospora africana]